MVQRSKALLEDLDTQKADVLSVTELNRTLKQILRNQVALMHAFEGVLDAAPEPSSQPSPQPSPRPTSALRSNVAEVPAGSSDPAVQIRVAGKPSSNGVGASELPSSGLPSSELPSSELPSSEFPSSGDDSSDTDSEWVPEDELHEDEPASGGDDDPQGVGAVEDTPSEPESYAYAWLGEARVVPFYVARGFVEAFDNRDKDFDKGLEKLNRWVSGSGGTPIQYRADRAYLNVHAGSAHSVKNYEVQLMERMGFSRRLGRLEVEGLDGEVVVYERPS